MDQGSMFCPLPLRWPAETDSLQNLSIFSHFHASLAIQPQANRRWIIFKGLCQKLFQSLGFNVLKSRREFSSSLRNRHRQRIWAKTVDHNADIKFEPTVRLRKLATKSTFATSPSARRVRRKPLSHIVTGNDFGQGCYRIFENIVLSCNISNIQDELLLNGRAVRWGMWQRLILSLACVI